MEGKVALADGKVALADEKVALTGKEGIGTNSETSFSSTDYRELLRAKLGKMTFNEVSKNRMIEMLYTYGFSSEFGHSQVVDNINWHPLQQVNF